MYRERIGKKNAITTLLAPLPKIQGGCSVGHQLVLAQSYTI